jgi:hypothetical protein
MSFAYGGRLVLSITEIGSNLGLLTGVTPVEDYYNITSGRAPYDLKTTADGMLLMYTQLSPRESIVGNPFVNEADYRIIHFSHGEKILSARAYLNPDGLDGFAALARIDQACGDEKIARYVSCRKAAFAEFDGDKNGRLDYRELALGYRKVSFLAGSNTCQLETYFPADTATAGPLFAAEIIGRADKDGDKAVTMDELAAGWRGFEQADNTKQFLKMAYSLAFIVPFMPKGEILPGCKEPCMASTGGSGN